ncbi:MAG: tol-pal system protein YbgF [Syntrophus sp. (in: bacteria)]|nr:tol-pal system protein YbgF [Syntrophus sp. (in: bacteria)]
MVLTRAGLRQYPSEKKCPLIRAIQKEPGQKTDGSISKLIKRSSAMSNILQAIQKKRLVVFSTVLIALLFGCATTEQTGQLQKSLVSLQSEILQLRQETDTKLSNMAKENEALSKQVVSIYSSVESRDDKIKIIMGKLDELEYQLRTYWAETKTILNTRKKTDNRPFAPQTPADKSANPAIDGKYEDTYKDAFETFQKGRYEEASKKFSAFIESYGGTPFASNAYYWIGECYMNLKNYDQAILNFQEIIDKYPKSEKAPRALLSQAEAFRQTNDKKSSITILKRVIELYPKTEEAIIAERKLRNSSL